MFTLLTLQVAKFAHHLVLGRSCFFKLNQHFLVANRCLLWMSMECMRAVPLIHSAAKTHRGGE